MSSRPGDRGGAAGAPLPLLLLPLHCLPPWRAAATGADTCTHALMVHMWILLCCRRYHLFTENDGLLVEHQYALPPPVAVNSHPRLRGVRGGAGGSCCGC